MFEFSCRCTQEHSFDPGDPWYLTYDVFTEEGDRRYKTNAEATEILRGLSHLNDSGQKIYETRLQPWQKTYERAVHGDIDWVRITVHNLLR